MTGQEAAHLREAKGYTQGALAELLGLSAATVCRREERQEVPPDFAEALRGLPPAPEGAAKPKGSYRPAKPAQRGTRERKREPQLRRATFAPATEAGATELDGDQVLAEEALVTVLLLLEAVRRLVAGRRIAEEVDRAFALLHLPSHARPPPLPFPRRRCLVCLR